MVTIVTGTTNKPTASEAVKQFFQTHSEIDGYLYIGYPIIGTVDGAYPIDALLISPEKGIVAFNLIEGKNTNGYEEAQDDCANKIEAKLKGYKQLVNKRTFVHRRQPAASETAAPLHQIHGDGVFHSPYTQSGSHRP